MADGDLARDPVNLPAQIVARQSGNATVGILVVSWDPPWDAALRQSKCSKFIRPRSLPRRFREIGRDDKGLVLVSRHACFRIQWNACQDRLRLKCLAGDTPAARRAFEPAAGPPVAGYTLNVARWRTAAERGSIRGLLHLQSSDSRLPEASLVLNPPFVSGWLSDGRRWGSPYFVGEHPSAPHHPSTTKSSNPL